MKFNKLYIWSAILLLAGIGSIGKSGLSAVIYALGSVTMLPIIANKLKINSNKRMIVIFAVVATIATFVGHNRMESAKAKNTIEVSTTKEQQNIHNNSKDASVKESKALPSNECNNFDIEQIRTRFENIYNTKMTRYGYPMPWFYGKDIDKKSQFALIIGYDSLNLKNIVVSSIDNQKYNEFGTTAIIEINKILKKMNLKQIEHPKEISEALEVREGNLCWEYVLNYQINYDNPNAKNWGFTLEVNKK